MPIKRTYFFTFGLACLFLSCTKKNTPPPNPPPVNKPFVTDVYVTGEKVISGATYGILWKNGAQVSLVSDINSSLSAVLTVDTDVYVAGTTYLRAAYWKNGSLKFNSPNSSNAYAIAVSGNDVYLAGSSFHSGDTYARAAYWKNGIETDLTDGTVIASLYGIAVNGSDVYVTGQKNLPDENNVAGQAVATCWKNGVIIPLAVSSALGDQSFGKGIAINGSDVYVAGYENFNVVCWKNGVPLPLDDNTGSPLDTYGFAVAINGTDIYVGGEHGNEAAYWKNGTIHDLISGAYVASGISGFSFQGADVYMSGTLNSVPTIWKNDTTSTLQNNGEQYSVSGISVSRHQ